MLLFSKQLTDKNVVDWTQTMAIRLYEAFISFWGLGEAAAVRCQLYQQMQQDDGWGIPVKTGRSFSPKLVYYLISDNPVSASSG